MWDPRLTSERRAWRDWLALGRIYRPLAMIAVVPIVAFGAGAGVMAVAELRRSPVVLALAPSPIATTREGTPVAVQGQVAEIFGNKFVIQDSSGRALVETGPEGDGGKLVAPSETVTVQGRFEHGFLRAGSISHADGHSDILGPPGKPPRPGLMSWGGPRDAARRMGLAPRG